MSRIGKLPVPLPAGVEVKLDADNLTVKGPKGALNMTVHENMTVQIEDAQVVVTRPDDQRDNRALHGMTRALINNMVVGVTTGYKKQLEIQGVGFQAELKGRILNFKLGFTHAVVLHLPEGIDVVCAKPTEIEVSGIDKQLVGEVAAVIRGFKPPEPYKGKGIRYKGEYVERKSGKAGKTA
jgi:large subunit ribosomal protein L6